MGTQGTEAPWPALLVNVVAQGAKNDATMNPAFIALVELYIEPGRRAKGSMQLAYLKNEQRWQDAMVLELHRSLDEHGRGTVLDVDGDGKVTQEEIDKYNASLDANGDGKVSDDEKIRFIKVRPPGGREGVGGGIEERIGEETTASRYGRRLPRYGRWLSMSCCTA